MQNKKKFVWKIIEVIHKMTKKKFRKTAVNTSFLLLQFGTREPNF